VSGELNVPTALPSEEEPPVPWDPSVGLGVGCLFLAYAARSLVVIPAPTSQHIVLFSNEIEEFILKVNM
jgi:hypothetical protein